MDGGNSPAKNPNLRRIVLFGVIAIAAVAGGAWLLGFRNTTTPVAPEDVISSLTAATTTTTISASTATTTAPSSTVAPPPGAVAYVYATSGYEQVDALGGARHDYPAETYLSERPGGCGTVFRWDALRERFTEWEVCDGRLASHRSFHSWFGQDDDEVSTCEGDNYWLPPDDGATTWSYTCTSAESSSDYTVDLQGIEPVAIGGASVDAYHLVITSITATGRTSGTSSNEVWRTVDGGLPVRESSVDQSTTDSPIGPVAYEERVDLRVASLDPLS